MKSDAQLREEIIRDLPETTDFVERVAGDLWSTLYSGNNTQHDVKQAVGNALEAAGVPTLQAMAEELEHTKDALRAIIATNDEDWDCEDLREIARAALAEGEKK